MDEQEQIKHLIVETEEAIKFFSNEKKPDLERSTCAAFLRCHGIDVNVEEIESYSDEPPDVIYKEARFEIKELLDDDRRRHDEYKKKLERLKKAKKLSDLSQPYTPTFVTIRDIAKRSCTLLEKHSKRYDKALISSLDILIYFNLMDYYLDEEFVEPDITDLKAQGWRSVSMVSGSSAFVFCAQDSAPDFLLKNVGDLKQPSNIMGLFDLE